MTLKSDFDDLKAKVTGLRTVEDSGIALMQGLKQKLDDLGNQETIDPADVRALSAQLDTDTTDLASAIAANTPAAPAP